MSLPLLAFAANAPLPAQSTAADAAAAAPATKRAKHTDPSIAGSEPVRLAAQALLVDSVRVGEDIIAVGERGTIVRGAGASWRQVAAIPTRASLTAAHAVDREIWVVGHDGVILHSGDAGLTWQRQRVDAWDAESADPQSGVPLLDVLFLDAQHGFAVGAYSLFLETRDGGKTWTRRSLLAGSPGLADAPEDSGEVVAEVDDAADAVAAEDADAESPTAPEDEADAENETWNFSADELDLEQESDPHLNAIARTGSGGLIIASERGTAFRSRDRGVTWQRLKLPYAGSMFGALGFDGDHALLFGLRGNVLETQDLGDTWQVVDSGVEASLMGGSATGDGGALVVGANGVMLRRGNASQAFEVLRYRTQEGESPILAGVITDARGGIVVLGERGIAPFRN